MFIFLKPHLHSKSSTFMPVDGSEGIIMWWLRFFACVLKVPEHPYLQTSKRCLIPTALIYLFRYKHFLIESFSVFIPESSTTRREKLGGSAANCYIRVDGIFAELLSSRAVTPFVS